VGETVSVRLVDSEAVFGSLHCRFLSSSWPQFSLEIQKSQLDCRIIVNSPKLKPGKDCIVAATDCGVFSGNPSPSLEKFLFLAPLSAFVSL